MRKTLALLLLLTSFSLSAYEGCMVPKARKPRFAFCKRGKVDPLWVPAALIGGGVGGAIAMNQPNPDPVIAPAAELISFSVTAFTVEEINAVVVVQIRTESNVLLGTIQLEGEGVLTGSFQVSNPRTGRYIMRLIQATGGFLEASGEIAVDGSTVVPPAAFTTPPPSEISYDLVSP